MVFTWNSTKSRFPNNASPHEHLFNQPAAAAPRYRRPHFLQPAAVFTGKYVMVMGVIQAVSPEPVVRAVKMADLSELAALHRRMWKLEVEELQQVLSWRKSCERRCRDDLRLPRTSSRGRNVKVVRDWTARSLKLSGSWLVGGTRKMAMWRQKNPSTQKYPGFFMFTDPKLSDLWSWTNCSILADLISQCSPPSFGSDFGSEAQRCRITATFPPILPRSTTTRAKILQFIHPEFLNGGEAQVDILPDSSHFGFISLC